MAFGGKLNRGRGNVDAVAGKPVPPLQVAEVPAIAAAGIDDDVVARRCQYRGDGLEHRPRHACLMDAPACRHRLLGITRQLRAALLRLQQVDVAAASDVKRVSLRTDETS